MAFISCRLELRFIFAGCRPWFTIIITSMFWQWPSYRADWSCGLYFPVVDPDLQLLLPPCFDNGLHIVQTGAAVYICRLQTLIYNYYYLHVLTIAFISYRLELQFMFTGCRPWFTIIITSMFWLWPSYRADWSCSLYLPVANPDLQLLLPLCFDYSLYIMQTGAAVYFCQLQTPIYDYYYLHVLTIAFISCRLELQFIFDGCRPWFTIIITSMFWQWPSYHAAWSWFIFAGCRPWFTIIITSMFWL